MILLSAQGMPVPKIAEVSFTSGDRVRDVIHNFNYATARDRMGDREHPVGSDATVGPEIVDAAVSAGLSTINTPSSPSTTPMLNPAR